MLYAYQTRSEISGFLDTPIGIIGNNIKQLPLNHWPPSLSRSIQPYSFCGGAQPNVARMRCRDRQLGTSKTRRDAKFKYLCHEKWCFQRKPFKATDPPTLQNIATICHLFCQKSTV